MQHSQCKSEMHDIIKCLIHGMKYYYEDNEEATWGTDKWHMPVKHIINMLVAKDNRPFIFTGEFDVQDDNPTAYCGINFSDKFITGKGSHWTFKDGIKPATKEQRELLFSKMKQEGYEWNSEKN